MKRCETVVLKPANMHDFPPQTFSQAKHVSQAAAVWMHNNTSSYVVHSSSQETKYGNGAVTVMEHMLKSEGKSLG